MGEITAIHFRQPLSQSILKAFKRRRSRKRKGVETGVEFPLESIRGKIGELHKTLDTLHQLKHLKQKRPAMPSPWVDNSGITFCAALSELQQLAPTLADAGALRSKAGAAGARESNNLGTRC
eukprot:62780-Pyramimonas_sp.AAC.1